MSKSAEISDVTEVSTDSPVMDDLDALFEAIPTIKDTQIKNFDNWIKTVSDAVSIIRTKVDRLLNQ